MTIAVCIVGFRNAAEVAACVAALDVQSYADISVVICENGGAAAFTALGDLLPAHLSQGQSVTTLSAEDNPGYAGGVNRCILASPDASGWWVLNPDTLPESGALQALVERLDRGDVDAVGGILYQPDGRVQAYGGRWRGWLARPVSIGKGKPLGDPVDGAAVEAAQNYLLGASMLVSRRFVDVAGLMRDDYFLYCEEVEWALRAARLGLRLGFAPDARVLHGQGSTTGSGESLHDRPRLPVYMDERNKLHTVRDTTPMRLVLAIPAAFVLILMRYARRGAWRSTSYALSGWWAGVVGKRGVPAWLAR